MQVVSEARKLIIKVPASTKKAKFPSDAAISKYGQNNDQPVIVVFNSTDGDGKWQGADSENGVVILNEVPGEIAAELLNMIRPESIDRAYSDTNDKLAKDAAEAWILANPFTVEKLQAILLKAAELGCGDQYTTDSTFVKDQLSPAGRMIDACTGIVKRDCCDVTLVVRDEEGKIHTKLANGNNRHIEEDILLRTHCKANGSQIDIDEIPTAETD